MSSLLAYWNVLIFNIAGHSQSQQDHNNIRITIPADKSQERIKCSLTS